MRADRSRKDESRVFVLGKLSEIGAPMNMLEIGFSATPHLLRSMAASGLIRVTVDITERRKTHLCAARSKALRKAAKERKEAHAAKVVAA